MLQHQIRRVMNVAVLASSVAIHAVSVASVENVAKDAMIVTIEDHVQTRGHATIVVSISTAKVVTAVMTTVTGAITAITGVLVHKVATLLRHGLALQVAHVQETTPSAVDKA